MLVRLGDKGTCLVVGLLALRLLGTAVAAGPDTEDPILAFVKPRLKHPGRPFTLVVRLQAKEGAGGRLEAAFAKALRATRQEKGNLAYDLDRDAQDSSRYLVYERWKGLADLEAHLRTPPIQALLAELQEVAAAPPELQVLFPAGE